MDARFADPDLLLRISAIEGLSARDLPLLLGCGGASGPGRPSPVSPDAGGEEGRIHRGRAALRARDSGERARAVRARCERAGIAIVPFGAPGYPAPLRLIPDPPLVLFWRGVPWTGRPAVAIVGSRAPTAPAREFARLLAADLSLGGWTVVSGMARGIDAAAHEGALDGAGGTVAVLGCGADVIYPPEAAGLAARIAARGAIVSEYPPGTPPRPHRFPRRNRLISGLCRGVVVAEAARRSGALVTARCALDQGREVLAVPGNPLFPHTAGSNGLLRDGAAPATGAEDVLSSLRGADDGEDAPGETVSAVLRFLRGRDPAHADEIAEALGLPASRLLPCLLEMELGKLLERTAGDYYKKMSRIRGESPVTDGDAP